MGSKRKPNPLPTSANDIEDSAESPEPPCMDDESIPAALWSEIDWMHEKILRLEKKNARLNSLVDILAEELFFLAAVSEVSEAAITFDDLLGDDMFRGQDVSEDY